jgi:hypothetical protein
LLNFARGARANVLAAGPQISAKTELTPFFVAFPLLRKSGKVEFRLLFSYSQKFENDYFFKLTIIHNAPTFSSLLICYLLVKNLIFLDFKNRVDPIFP